MSPLSGQPRLDLVEPFSSVPLQADIGGARNWNALPTELCRLGGINIFSC